MKKPLHKLSPEEIAEELSEHLNCRPNAFRKIRMSNLYALILRKCILGRKSKDIAEWLKKKDEVFEDMSVESITRMLNRFKQHLKKSKKIPRLSDSIMEIIVDKIDFVGTELLAEKEKLYKVQKERVSRGLEAEAHLPVLLESVSKELDLLNKILKEIIELRISFGLPVTGGTPDGDTAATSITRKIIAIMAAASDQPVSEVKKDFYEAMEKRLKEIENEL